MQISGVQQNPYVTNIQVQKTNSTEPFSSIATYEPPSADTLMDIAMERKSIERKVEEKQKELEQNLTSFGVQADEMIKRVSKMASEMYRSVMEGDLRQKIESMSLKERMAQIFQSDYLKTYSQNQSFSITA